jgi:hypothetical protein
MGAVDALKRGPGVATKSDAKVTGMEHVHQPGQEESPVDLLRQLRIREEALAALLARAVEGAQMALAALYDETNALVYGLALRILRDQYAAEVQL